MHLSANDIATFTTGRETVIIGPAGAFGVQENDLLLDGETEIKRVFDRLVHRFHGGPAIRAQLRNWGVDTSAATRRETSFFPQWLTDLAMRGVIRVGMTPEPIFAFASVYNLQRQAFERTASFARSARETRSGQLPGPVEHRLVLALERAVELMAGEPQAALRTLLQRTGVGPVAGTLLAWVDASDAESANLSLLVYDLPIVSGEVLRAVDRLAEAIEALRAIRLVSDIDGPAAELASALAVLWSNGVLRRFLRARQQSLGLSQRDVANADDSKPNLSKTEIRRPVRQAAAPMPGPGKGSAGGGVAGASQGGAGQKALEQTAQMSKSGQASGGGAAGQLASGLAGAAAQAAGAAAASQKASGQAAQMGKGGQASGSGAAAQAAGVGAAGPAASGQAAQMGKGGQASGGGAAAHASGSGAAGQLASGQAGAAAQAAGAAAAGQKASGHTAQMGKGGEASGGGAAAQASGSGAAGQPASGQAGAAAQAAGAAAAGQKASGHTALMGKSGEASGGG